jgi:uroporphyrinogen-III synthase
VSILLLRSGDDDLPELPEDVELVRTHDLHPRAEGIAEAERVPPEGTWLLVSSRVTVRVMPPAFFARPFARTLVSGAETASALKRAGVSRVDVPERPGAAGMLELVTRRATRILWPRGSDADPAPVEALFARGIEAIAPVVYEKSPRPALDPAVLSRVAAGDYGGIAVSSLAALDVLLASLSAARLAPHPSLRWGVIGPESARAFERYSLPRPLVPEKPRLPDLLEDLRKASA